MVKCFFYFVFVSMFCFREGAVKVKADMRGLRDEQDRAVLCEAHKEPIKIKKKSFFTFLGLR